MRYFVLKRHVTTIDFMVYCLHVEGSLAIKLPICLVKTLPLFNAGCGFLKTMVLVGYMTAKDLVVHAD